MSLEYKNRFLVQEQETALRFELCTARQEAQALREELYSRLLYSHLLVSDVQQNERHCRVDSACIRQSRPDSGPGLSHSQSTNVLKPFGAVSSPLGSCWRLGDFLSARPIVVQEQETALRVELCAARQEALALREELYSLSLVSAVPPLYKTVKARFWPWLEPFSKNERL